MVVSCPSPKTQCHCKIYPCEVVDWSINETKEPLQFIVLFENSATGSGLICTTLVLVLMQWFEFSTVSMTVNGPAVV